MTVEFALNAEVRSDLGKGASRRLRRNVCHGACRDLRWRQSPAIRSACWPKNLAKLLENEAAFSHVLSLNVAGTREAS